MKVSVRVRVRVRVGARREEHEAVLGLGRELGQYLAYISLYLAYISPISRQELTISSPMLNATIWSAPANKFYAKEKQLKFAHLNVDLNWAKGSASGLLTELAGDRPMSRASRMLLKSPLDAKAPDGKPQIKIEP